MTKELIFHLGDFRTGSTAIQSVLRENASSFGLSWPGKANHAGLAQSLHDRNAQEKEWAWLASRFHDLDHSVVVSAEHFEFADPRLLSDAIEAHLPGVPVRLISYVRPHGPALLARYAESIKIGSFGGTPAEYLDWPQTRWRLSYADRFKRWRATFGERFKLRFFDRQAFPGRSVVQDFIRFASGNDPGNLSVPDQNPTPNVKDIVLTRALHEHIGKLPEDAKFARWTLGRHIGRLITQDQAKSEPLRADRALAHQIEAQFTKDASRLDEEFFAPRSPMGDALANFVMSAQPDAMSLEPEDHLTDDELRIVRLWAGMLRDGLSAPGGAEVLNGLYHE